MAGERLLPVVVKEPDGTTVRVGEAVVGADEVVLTLDAKLQLSPRDAKRSATQARGLADLELMAERSRRVLEDPSKRRWHADMQRQLTDIEAEMARLRAQH